MRQFWGIHLVRGGATVALLRSLGLDATRFRWWVAALALSFIYVTFEEWTP